MSSSGITDPPLTQEQIDRFGVNPETVFGEHHTKLPEVITTPKYEPDSSSVFDPVAGFLKKTGDFIGDSVSSVGDNITGSVTSLLVVLILVMILFFLLKHMQYKCSNKHKRGNRRSSIPYRECVHQGCSNCPATIPLSSSCEKV